MRIPLFEVLIINKSSVSDFKSETKLHIFAVLITQNVYCKTQ